MVSCENKARFIFFAVLVLSGFSVPAVLYMHSDLCSQDWCDVAGKWLLIIGTPVFLLCSVILCCVMIYKMGLKPVTQQCVQCCRKNTSRSRQPSISTISLDSIATVSRSGAAYTIYATTTTTTAEPSAPPTPLSALDELTSSEELREHILPLTADSTPWTIISDLITHTWVTNKQGTSNNNTPISITSILQVLNVKTLGPYIQKTNIITAETVTENDFDRSKILTFQFQQGHGIQGYQKDEVYLFHGTSMKNMLNIMKNGFNLAKASSSHGSLYGAAIYLPDSAEKANHYTMQGKKTGTDLILILARVKVGRMYKHTSAGAPPKEKTQGYDSVVVDRSTSGNNFKEFLIYDGSRILPEYVIIYNRV